MKNTYLTISTVLVALLFCVPAQAETPKEITDRVVVVSKVEGCDIDLKQHCAGVTPGDNREILCLVAHEDKLLDKCQAGLIEAAIAVQLGVATLDYAHESCGSDRVKLCGEVKAGGGRLLNCLKSNQSQTSEQCVTALKQTGLWDAVLEPASGN
jgi:hypothetical protein